MLVTDPSRSPNLDILSTDRLFQILKDMNRPDEQTTSLDVVREVIETTDATTIVLGSFMR
jgi:hypothetical protein